MERPIRQVSLGLAVFALGLCSVVAAEARDHTPTAQDCAALTTARLAIVDHAAGEHGDREQGAFLAKKLEPTLTSATLVAAAGQIPEYCRVLGFITTGDADEGFNTVRFAVNLPTLWNGRFVALGDGGHDGVVSTSTVRLNQGYATANSDLGHDATVFPGATFAFNDRPREIDYGWRAVQRYYGSPPAFSYWDGCSTGGREAAVEAQRFPDDFDGIAGGDLFMNAIEIAMEQVWSSAVFFRDVNGDGVGFDNNITQADIDALRDAVLAKCDVLENDTIRDNVVGNPLACARVFTSADIDALGLARGLTPGQVQAIKDVYTAGTKARVSGRNSAGVASLSRRRPTISSPPRVDSRWNS